MYKSDPPQFCHYNCIFVNIQHLILDFVNSINYNHLEHIYVLLTARLGILLRSKRQRDLCQSQAQRCMLLRCAHGMSDKQFVYADRAVFSTSKVC